MSNNNTNPASPRQATQADAGWRTKENTSRQATQADTGWRSQQEAAARLATQADAGWRHKDAAAARLATQADTGWRFQEAAQQPAAYAEPAYPREDGPLSIENLMQQVTADAFSDTEAFKDAVAALTKLESANGNHYTVERTLSRAGGEAIILLCTDAAGQPVAAKVYRERVNSAGSSISARLRVLEYMGTEAGQRYTLAVQDIGLVTFDKSNYYFEILPYCPQGDMSSIPALSFEELVELTAVMNEALHTMHRSGILHRDIKPDNLYRLEDRVVLGDFGVARLSGGGATTVTVGTDGYRAPETVLAVSGEGAAFYFDEKCDYYSLGVTLGSLFEGHFIYKNLNAAMMTAAVRNGRLPLTRQDPHREELENLLSGLCRFDSRFRFGYEEVCSWLRDHHYTGGTMGEEWPRPYHVDGKPCRDEKSLFEAITSSESNWEEAKDQLFRKYFESFFRTFRIDLASAAQNAEEDYRKGNKDKALSVFLKSLYAPGPIVWRGYTFHSLQELAQRMQVTQNPASYADMLKHNCISHWLRHTEGIRVDAQTLALVDEIERLATRSPQIACYWFGNAFAGQRKVEVCGQTVTSFPELVEALFSDPYRFYELDGMDKLMDMKMGAALYGFLYSLGCKDIVQKQWKYAADCDTFNKLSFLLAMLDLIGLKLNADTGLIRKFYLEYGPMGIASYTQQLVKSTKPKVYEPLDSEGKSLLSRISKFSVKKYQDLSEAHRLYTPLMEDVDVLYRALVNNPFCAQAGAYEHSGVVCCNLVGCFAFEIFGKMAPLGFHAHLSESKGGTKA